MKKLLFVLISLFAAVASAANISPLLVPVDNTASPQAPAHFMLVYLNSGSAAMTVHFPPRVEVSVESAGVTHEQSMICMSQLAEQTIAPGSFCRATYQLNMPPDVAGHAIIKLKAYDSAPVVVAIAPPPAQPATTAAPMVAKVEHQTPASATAIASSDTTQPTAADHHWFGDPLTESFAGRFSTYQPMYFIAGSRPTAKFQISLKYKIFDDDGYLADKFSPLNHLYLAYTQTSFWDWVSPSSPFTDNSYRPELMFSYDNILPKNSTLWDLSELGLQGGFQHESNGRDGLASRSMNLVYIRPIFIWDLDKTDGWFVSLAPRVFAYVTSLSDNPDIAQYRGYGDVRLVIGQHYGFQVAFFARMGEDFDKGSLEIDLSQPLRQRSSGNLDLYLYAQFFTGYGEQLIQYNKSTTTFRIGVAFVR